MTLDTGRLFPETYQVWAETEQRYGRRIRALSPEHRSVEAWVARHGIDGFRASVEARQACCAVRKVEPLRPRARRRRRPGSPACARSNRPIARRRLMRRSIRRIGLLKVNPLLDWTRERVVDFVREHDVPYNALHDRGFLSIGCAPCTRAVAPGEPERAGRWWWEQDEKKECGLHAGRAAPRERARACDRSNRNNAVHGMITTARSRSSDALRPPSTAPAAA